MLQKGLRHGRPGPNSIHLCVDMQRMFGPGYPWAMIWLERILPKVVDLCTYNPARTIFTRFVPPRSPDDAGGNWRPYYRKWEEVTLDRMGAEGVALLPALEGFVPPAQLVNKTVYSPWHDPALRTILNRGGVDTLIITGGETDVCVLATALGAIDLGYRVILIEDALCSSTDRTHDNLIDLYATRFDIQIETSETEEILDCWPRA